MQQCDKVIDGIIEIEVIMLQKNKLKCNFKKNLHLPHFNKIVFDYLTSTHSVCMSPI